MSWYDGAAAPAEIADGEGAVGVAIGKDKSSERVRIQVGATALLLTADECESFCDGLMGIVAELRTGGGLA